MKRLAALLALALLLVCRPASAQDVTAYQGSNVADAGRGSGWQGFSPTWMPAGKFWLSSDSGITTATGVSNWVDRFAGLSFAQVTGALQPALVASDSTFRGHPSLNYAGASGFTLSNAISIVQPFTVCVVGNWGAGALSQQAFIESSSPRTTFRQNSAKTQIEIFSGTIVDGGSVVTTPQVYCYVANGASSAAYQASATVAAVSGNAGANGIGTVFIGGPTADSDPLAGKVVQVAAFGVALDAYWRGRYFAWASNLEGVPYQ